VLVEYHTTFDAAEERGRVPNAKRANNILLPMSRERGKRQKRGEEDKGVFFLKEGEKGKRRGISTQMKNHSLPFRIRREEKK